MKKNKILLILLVLVALVMGYITYISQIKRESEITKAKKMNSTGDKNIDNLITNLKKSMEDYMKIANPSYSQNDIDDCATLLSAYSLGMFKTHSKEEGMEIVKATILKLNALNDKCDNTLIETNEREQIAEIIILVGNKMGYNSIDEDITEEWREW